MRDYGQQFLQILLCSPFRFQSILYRIHIKNDAHDANPEIQVVHDVLQHRSFETQLVHR